MTRSLARIREESRNVLAGNYTLYFFVLLLTGILTTFVNQIVSYLAWPFSRSGFVLMLLINLVLDYLVLIAAKLLQAGQYFLSLNIARGNRAAVTDLFLAFRYDTPKALKISAILALIEAVCTTPFQITLSNLASAGAFHIGSESSISVLSVIVALLCSLAGMILLETAFAFPLSLALFLYIDHQEYSAAECLQKSRTLMKGHVLEFFRLHLSLAGYFALCVLSLGIGLIWILPYLNVIRANYYMNLTGLYKPY